ncbi:hypothetical protein MTO96_034298 [Rhipicephalus appendiculatus]
MAFHEFFRVPTLRGGIRQGLLQTVPNPLDADVVLQEVRVNPPAKVAIARSGGSSSTVTRGVSQVEVSEDLHEFPGVVC